MRTKEKYTRTHVEIIALWPYSQPKKMGWGKELSVNQGHGGLEGREKSEQSCVVCLSGPILFSLVWRKTGEFLSFPNINDRRQLLKIDKGMSNIENRCFWSEHLLQKEINKRVKGKGWKKSVAFNSKITESQLFVLAHREHDEFGWLENSRNHNPEVFRPDWIFEHVDLGFVALPIAIWSAV